MAEKGDVLEPGMSAMTFMVKIIVLQDTTILLCILILRHKSTNDWIISKVRW